MAEPAPLADAIGIGGGWPIDFSRWDGRGAFIMHIDADIVPSRADHEGGTRAAEVAR